MEGTILDFNTETGEGLIRGEDKARYTFTRGEWKSEKSPKTQLTVDFEIEGDKATNIYALDSKGFDVPNVDINGMKDKFNDARESVSANPMIKKILDNGIFNKLSLAFILIAFFGTLTDVITLGELGSMLGADGTVPGSSISSFGIGWLLVLTLIAMFIATGIGVPRKIVRYIGMACAALFAWQVYSMIDQLIELSRMMGGFSPRSMNISIFAAGFVLISFVLLLVATFIPKKESPAFD